MSCLRESVRISKRRHLGVKGATSSLDCLAATSLILFPSANLCQVLNSALTLNFSIGLTVSTERQILYDILEVV